MNAKKIRIARKTTVAIVVTVVAWSLIFYMGVLDGFQHGYFCDAIDPSCITPEGFWDQLELSQTIKGSFEATNSHFRGIQLYLTNLAEGESGIVSVTLEDSQGQEVGRGFENLNEAVNDHWFSVFFSAKLNLGEQYNYTITVDGCKGSPCIPVVDGDYMGNYDDEGALLVDVGYAKPTFSFQERVLISLLLFSMWMYVVIVPNVHGRALKKTMRSITVALFMVLCMTWVFLFNSLDDDNVAFKTFDDFSQTLVTGMYHAEVEHGEGAKYGLGRYADYRGEIYAENASLLTDENWDKGYSRTEPKLLLGKAAFLMDVTSPGNYIRFANGDVFRIADRNVSEYDTTIVLETEAPLTPYKYGDIMDARFLDESGKELVYCSISPYMSQYGLQGRVFGYLARYIDEDLRSPIFGLCCAIMAAAVFVSISWLLCRKYNVIFAGCFYGVFFLSPWVINFSRNLYWVEFTWFVPMAIGLFCAWKISDRKYRICSYVAMYFSILCKNLCGYEYVTTVMLGAIAFLLVDLLVSILEKNSHMTKLLFRTTFIIGSAALLGFATALLLHAEIRGEGRLVDGLRSIIVNDVMRRTSGVNLNVASGFRGAELEALTASTWETLCKYFHFSTDVIIGMDKSQFILLCVIPLLIIGNDYRQGKRRVNDLAMYVVMLLVTLSWIVLARTHSYVHTHLNYVLWYFGFVQVCFYIIIGKFAELVKWKNRCGKAVES